MRMHFCTAVIVLLLLGCARLLIYVGVCMQQEHNIGYLNRKVYSLLNCLDCAYVL